MKQKILYILVLIAAWIGGSGLVWAQYGYISHTSNTIVFEKTKTDLTVNNNRMTISNTTQLDNQSIKVTFTLGDNVLSNQGGACNLTIRGAKTNEFKWSLDDYYCINLTKLGANLTASWSETMTFTSSDGKSVSQKVGWSDKDIELTGMNLNEAGKITLQTTGNDNYIHRLTYTYTLSYYELDVTALESAISAANNALSSITDETMKGYLNTAIANAESFKTDCAFPNSYWNGSSVGKTPAEVTATAEKLNAITNYLIARTNANKFEKSKVPDAIYNWLHTYDQYNPNDYDTETINNATNDINAAINAASATTSAYQSALTTIASAENSSDKTNDQETLTTDIAKAKEQLELAKSVEEINSALANIKSFDAISFNSQNEIQEGSTLDNPASTISDKAITYTSSDNTIIDGTTLKALKAGTVTITATTTTGNGYYGCTKTKEFTVTPKAVILNPINECTIVPNTVYPEITLERTFSAKTHYTLTLPFDSYISEIGGDYAAQLDLVTFNQADGYTLYFKQIPDGYMRANQPYIVYAENGFNESLEWTNITVAETIEAKEVCNDRTQGWTMQGNYTPGLDMEGKYGIAGGQFRLGTKDSYINAYTAYFTFLGTQNVRARVAVMDEGGNTTYIGELKDGVLQTEEGIYGLDGVQQNQLRKGINIVRQKDGSVRKILK